MGRVISPYILEHDMTELAIRAKEKVLYHHPDAFCQVSSVQRISPGMMVVYTIQRLVKSKNNEDGDDREDLGTSAFSEDNAWIYAADRVAQYDDYYAN